MRDLSRGGLHGATLALVLLLAAPAEAAAPYPPSETIVGVTFDAYRTAAPGCDGWPMTWAGSGEVFSAYGDGGCFGRSRTSNEFVRMTGPTTGVNLSAPFTGKVKGMLAEGSTLYAARCGDGANYANYKFQQLYRSTDGGMSWTGASWRWGSDFFCPDFVQTGPGNPGAYDYMLATVRHAPLDAWPEAQVPGELVMARAKRGTMLTQAAWQWWDGSGWGAYANRRPFFTDPEGISLASLYFDAPLDRYLLLTNCAGHRGCFAIYDAPSPTGPWTTAFYQDGWNAGGFLWHIYPPSVSGDGLSFTIVYAGPDRLNAVDVRLTRAAPAP